MRDLGVGCESRGRQRCLESIRCLGQTILCGFPGRRNKHLSVTRLRLCPGFPYRRVGLFRCLAGCFLFRRRLGSLVVSGRCRKLGGSGGIPCRVVFLPRAPKRRCRCLERGLCCRPVLFCESLRLGRLGLGSGVYDRFLRHCR